MQFHFAFVSLKVLDEESADNLVEAVKQDEEHTFIIGKAQHYMDSCMTLLKYIDCKDKLKFCYK